MQGLFWEVRGMREEVWRLQSNAPALTVGPARLTDAWGYALSDQTDLDLRINHTMHTPGWDDIRAIVEGMCREDEEFILHAMSRKPEALTRKVAIKHTARRAALLDFLETLDDKMRILESKRDR